MRIDVEELKQRLEEVGEDKVRERLVSGIYGQQERPIVEEWLFLKEREKNEKKMLEYDKIARSASRAAWAAAIAAIISAVAAIVAWIR